MKFLRGVCLRRKQQLIRFWGDQRYDLDPEMLFLLRLFEVREIALYTVAHKKHTKIVLVISSTKLT